MMMTPMIHVLLVVKEKDIASYMELNEETMNMNKTKDYEFLSKVCFEGDKEDNNNNDEVEAGYEPNTQVHSIFNKAIH